MSPTSFIQKTNGNAVDIIKTFGTFIDPACKAAAGITWPVIGNKVELTQMFMQLMGFGTSSSIQATTIDTGFNYEMKIGCGNACSGNNNCVLSSNNDADAQSYFAGNATKNTFLKTSGDTEAKVKFIVVKEWGDKLQVLFYLLKYKWKGGGETITFLTCDMPVFTLCINLNIPCIFTGAGKRPDGIPSPKKWYSIMEFLPGDAFERAASHLIAIRGHIESDNNRFINAIQALASHPDTQLKIGGSPVILPATFYGAALADLNSLMESGLNGQWSGAALQTEIDAAEALQPADKVPRLKLLEEQMKKDCLFIPFIANTKKMKELLNIGGPPNSLTVLEKKNYTKNSRGKPNFATIQPRFNNMSLRLIANAMKSHQGGGGRQQRGGAIADNRLYNQLFQGDSDELIEFRWDDDGQKLDVDDNRLSYEPSRFQQHLQFPQQYPPFNPIYAGVRSEVPPTAQNNGNNYNAQEELYTSFILVHKRYMDLLRQIGVAGWSSVDLAETIYTVFCYNSYIDNGADMVFADADYDKILIELEIKPTIQEALRRIVREINRPNENVHTGRQRGFAIRQGRRRREYTASPYKGHVQHRIRRRGGKGRKKTRKKRRKRKKTKRRRKTKRRKTKRRKTRRK